MNINEWVYINFAEVVDKISTNGKKVKQKEYLTEGKYPVIDQGQDFIGGFSDSVEKKIKVDTPVIVFGDHTKIVKVVKQDFVPGADGVKVLLPKPFYNSRLLSFFINVLTKKIPDKGYARHFQFLEKENIPLLPQPEQEQLVSLIEQLFSDLDNAIDNLKKAKDQLKVYRQSILKYALEGKLSKNCGTFKKVELRTVCEPVQNINKSVNPSDSFLYIDIGCIDNKTNRVVCNKQYSWKEAPSRAKQIIKSGDILFSTVRTYLKNIAMVPEKYDGQIGSTGFCVIRPKKDCLDSQYIFHYVLWDKFINHISTFQTGTSYPAVRDDDVFSQLVPVTDLPNQKLIVNEIESRFSVCDKMEETINDSLEQAEALRQSILKQAFEGKLTEEWRKNHADLIKGENSAKALLERIKKEREAIKNTKKRKK